jgi:hypothetical protein
VQELQGDPGFAQFGVDPGARSYGA